MGKKRTTRRINLKNEPLVFVHVTEELTLGDDRFMPGMYPTQLRVALTLLRQGKAHLCYLVEDDGEETEPINQVELVNWLVTEVGVTLAMLAEWAEVSRAMMTYVSRGQRRLSPERLKALLMSYSSWIDDYSK